MFEARHDADTQPSTRRFGTDYWLKLENCPSEWNDKLLQVQLYVKGEDEKWETTPIATSDRKVFGGGKLWQHNLTLLASDKSERASAWRDAPRLYNGKYLVRCYVDRTDKMHDDWRAELTDEDFAGEIVIDARWREGYQAMFECDASTISVKNSKPRP